jgi:hypothetical protein
VRAQPAGAVRPKATDVEPYGIETIPAGQRHSRPLDLFRITFGGAKATHLGML